MQKMACKLFQFKSAFTRNVSSLKQKKRKIVPRMIRLFRQRAADSLARCVACYSDAASPSTSRTEPDEIQVTRQRIKRWKSKSLALKKEERPAGRLDSRELQTVADQEEQFYAESAEEMMRILGEMTPVKSGEKILPVPKMTPEDIELKKKTGKVRFRRIIYDEGELDHSDLSKPPSPDNPHPYEPEKSAPPIYSRSIVPYVNTMPHLQTLVDLGVNLFEIDTNTNCGKFLLRLDQEKDIKPKLQWLISIGFEPEDIGDYITRNPFFLLQDLKDMQARVNYLEVHKFKPEQITKIVKEFRYWINTDVQTMDARLGWLQKQFQLKGNDVRYVITKEPRVIMFGLGPLKRIFDFLNKECQFTMYEIKRILLDDPRVFMMDPRYVQNNYMYASRVMQLPNAVISRTPFLLRCSISSLKNRHEFLRKLGRAHYEGQEHKVPPQDSDSNEPIEYVSMADLLHPKDAHFASKAAKSYLVVYDKFLRSH